MSYREGPGQVSNDTGLWYVSARVFDRTVTRQAYLRRTWIRGLSTARLVYRRSSQISDQKRSPDLVSLRNP